MALMRRHGVAAREVLLAKSGLPVRDVSRGLRELFLRGQLLRGFFVKSLSGDQFALPEALDFLRKAKPAASEPAIMISSVDPAAIHLSVVKLEGMLNRPLATRYLVLRRGELEDSQIPTALFLALLRDGALPAGHRAALLSALLGGDGAA